MRIGVLRTQVPFVSGGAERHAAGLVEALQRYGHEATEITLPFKWYPGEILADHILAAKLTDLSEVEGVPVDRMIGLKFPAYLARHPEMQFWIIHQHRQAYDQWQSGTSDLLDDQDGLALRELIRAEDRAAFMASPHPLHANSANVARRLQEHLGIASSPLYHPPPNADEMVQGSYGDYLFVPGRINPSKRLELVLDALASTNSKMRLVIAGTAENPEYAQELYKRSLAPEIKGRVEWLGSVDDATLRRHYAEARAVVFVPQDEDYGYVTLEAMLAGKPLITVSDAGGPLEFIRHEKEGLISDPTPRALGQAFERVMQDRGLAERMGQGGLAHYKDLNITWEHVVDTLVGPGVFGAGASKTAPLAAEEDHPDASERLQAAIAPPPPPAGLPFASVREVLEKYAFEELPAELGEDNPPVDQGLVNYLGTHWTRYLTTLSALDGLTPQRTLDVGVFPPLIFQALLAELFPGIEMSGLWEGPAPYVQQIKHRSDGAPAFSFQLKVGNAEREPWPYPDSSFDLVTGMEILEHLTIDPHFFFSEANRVLRPGGHLLLTTPNISSHRSLWRMMMGVSPYSFGTFVPSGGVYGRHNREYVPAELDEIGSSAGFETVKLRTHDVYGKEVAPEAAELLVARGEDLTMRGENILYLSRKVGTPTSPPERLFHGDTSLMAGSFHLGSEDPNTGDLQLGVENQSNGTWRTKGTKATCLLAEWIDPEGNLIHQILLQPFREPLRRGERAEVSVNLGQQGEPRGTLRLHFHQIGVGVFSGAGRAAPIDLPCSREAFLKLVRTWPEPEQGA